MKRLLVFLWIVSTTFGQVAAPPEALNNWPTANTALTLADPGADKVAGWSNSLHKWVWTTGGGPGGAVATDTIWDAKGDLAVGNGADSAIKLAVSVTNGQVLMVDSTTATGLKWAAAGGTGTVTSFSAGDLSPIFTTTEATVTTTPALSFTLSTAAAHTFLGNSTGSTATPGYVQPDFSDLSGHPTTAQLATTGTASSTTFLRGDLQWATPVSGGTGTVTNAANLADTALVVGDGGTVGIKTIAGYTVGTTGAVTNNLGANALTGLTMKRFTDSGQTGNFLDFKNAAGVSLWTTNISGTLTAGAVPEQRISYANPGANTIRVWDNTTAVAMTNATIGTGLLYTTGTPPSLAVSTNLQTWSGVAPTTNVQTFLTTPSSANLRAAITDENGTGAALFNAATTPDFTTGITIGGAATSRKVLVGDGTKFAASTETYAVPGTSGNLLTSDGTNWTSAAPVVSASSTTTFTNKRINPRVDSSTSASATTWAPNSDTTDVFELAGTLTVAVTTISNPSGTPVDGQKLMMRIKADATPHALTWSGSQWRNSSDLTLPGTTIASKTMYLGFVYNSIDTKWDLIAYLNNF